TLRRGNRELARAETDPASGPRSGAYVELNRRSSHKKAQKSQNIFEPFVPLCGYSFSCSAHFKIAFTLCSTSSSVVAQDETLIRIAVRPCQTVPPHQHVPSF